MKKFYSLLFISKEDSNPNLDENNYNNKIEIYINNVRYWISH